MDQLITVSTRRRKVSDIESTTNMSRGMGDATGSKGAHREQQQQHQQRHSTTTSSSVSPLDQLEESELDMTRHRLPNVFNALVRCDEIIKSNGVHLRAKEDELSKCIEVGQEVLDQLQDMKKRCTRLEQELSNVALENEELADENDRLKSSVPGAGRGGDITTNNNNVVDVLKDQIDELTNQNRILQRAMRNNADPSHSVGGATASDLEALRGRAREAERDLGEANAEKVALEHELRKARQALALQQQQHATTAPRQHVDVNRSTGNNISDGRFDGVAPGERVVANASDQVDLASASSMIATMRFEVDRAAGRLKSAIRPAATHPSSASPGRQPTAAITFHELRNEAEALHRETLHLVELIKADEDSNRHTESLLAASKENEMSTSDKLLDAQGQIRRLKNELAMSAESIESLQERLDRCEADKRKLVAELSGLGSTQAERETAVALANSKLTREIDAIRAKMVTLEGDNSSLQSKLSASQSEMHRLRNECTMLTDAGDAGRAELEVMKGRVSELQKTLAHLRGDQSETLEGRHALSRELDQYRANLAEKDGTIHTLTSKCQKLEGQLKQVEMGTETLRGALEGNAAVMRKESMHMQSSMSQLREDLLASEADARSLRDAYESVVDVLRRAGAQWISWRREAASALSPPRGSSPRHTTNNNDSPNAKSSRARSSSNMPYSSTTSRSGSVAAPAPNALLHQALLKQLQLTGDISEAPLRELEQLLYNSNARLPTALISNSSGDGGGGDVSPLLGQTMTNSEGGSQSPTNASHTNNNFLALPPLGAQMARSSSSVGAGGGVHRVPSSGGVGPTSGQRLVQGLFSGMRVVLEEQEYQKEAAFNEAIRQLSQEFRTSLANLRSEDDDTQRRNIEQITSDHQDEIKELEDNNEKLMQALTALKAEAMELAKSLEEAQSVEQTDKKERQAEVARLEEIVRKTNESYEKQAELHAVELSDAEEQRSELRNENRTLERRLVSLQKESDTLREDLQEFLDDNSTSSTEALKQSEATRQALKRSIDAALREISFIAQEADDTSIHLASIMAAHPTSSSSKGGLGNNTHNGSSSSLDRGGLNNSAVGGGGQHDSSNTTTTTTNMGGSVSTADGMVYQTLHDSITAIASILGSLQATIQPIAPSSGRNSPIGGRQSALLTTTTPISRQEVTATFDAFKTLPDRLSKINQNKFRMFHEAVQLRDQQFISLQSQVEEKDVEIAHCHRRLEAAECELEQLVLVRQKLESEVHEVRLSLNEANDNLHATTSRAVEAEAEVTRLQRRVDALNEEVEQLKSEEQSTGEHLEKKLHQLRDTLSKERAERAEESQSVEVEMSKLRELITKSAHEAQHARNELCSTRASLENDLEESEEENRELNEKLNNMDELLAEYKDKASEYSALLKASKIEISRANTEIDNLREVQHLSHDNTSKDKRELLEALKQAQTYVQELQGENASLRGGLAKDVSRATARDLFPSEGWMMLADLLGARWRGGNGGRVWRGHKRLVTIEGAAGVQYELSEVDSEDDELHKALTRAELGQSPSRHSPSRHSRYSVKHNTLIVGESSDDSDGGNVDESAALTALQSLSPMGALSAIKSVMMKAGSIKRLKQLIFVQQKRILELSENGELSRGKRAGIHADLDAMITKYNRAKADLVGCEDELEIAKEHARQLDVRLAAVEADRDPLRRHLHDVLLHDHQVPASAPPSLSSRRPTATSSSSQIARRSAREDRSAPIVSHQQHQHVAPVPVRHMYVQYRAEEEHDEVVPRVESPRHEAPVFAGNSTPRRLSSTIVAPPTTTTPLPANSSVTRSRGASLIAPPHLTSPPGSATRRPRAGSLRDRPPSSTPKGGRSRNTSLIQHDATPTKNNTTTPTNTTTIATVAPTTSASPHHHNGRGTTVTTTVPLDDLETFPGVSADTATADAYDSSSPARDESVDMDNNNNTTTDNDNHHHQPRVLPRRNPTTTTTNTSSSSRGIPVSSPSSVPYHAGGQDSVPSPSKEGAHHDKEHQHHKWGCM